jgi:hypothetical protein
MPVTVMRRVRDAAAMTARAWCAPAVALLLVTVSTGVRAQTPGAGNATADVRALSATSSVAINVALGAGTASLRAWRGHQPLWPAVRRGVVGGAVMAAGLHVGGRDLPAARFLGVQTVAVGASIARDAGEGRPMLSRMVVPLLPFVLELRVRGDNARGDDTSVSAANPPIARTREPRLRVRLSAAAMAGAVADLTESHGARVDWRESLANGSLVLRTTSAAFSDGAQCPVGLVCWRAGRQRLGIVTYRADGQSAEDIASTLQHESLHVAQRVRELVLMGMPSHTLIVSRAGRIGRVASRVLIVDAVAPLRAVDMLTTSLNGSHYMGWYEREARLSAPGHAATFLVNPVWR